MCGIIGLLDKRAGHDHHIGRTILAMLQALSCRGPDSAGVALFGARQPFWGLQVKLPEHAEPHAAAKTIVEVLQSVTPVFKHEVQGAYLRVQVTSLADPTELERTLLDRVPGT